MRVELRLLGQVEAWIEGRRVDLGHARQRCVMAVLAAEANRVVATEQLMDRVWGEHQPRRARQLVSNYLSLLRRLLAAGGLAGEVVIERRGGGYVLTVDPGCVDVHRFRSLVVGARAASDQTRALELLEQACGLWRGEALAGLDTSWIALVREGLERERFAADTDRLDLALRAGRQTALLPELTDRAAAHPLDERVAAQLMLALFRAGRQADALEHYRRIRLRLAEDLGTDPGPGLRQLHQRILSAETDLATPPAPSRRPPAVPHQLPAAPSAFTGRGPELSILDRDLVLGSHGNSVAGTVAISAIGGAGGIGKTWLAITWAHRNLHGFPDGQLFVDLQGFSPTGQPTEPADAVRGFLTALGATPNSVPPDLDAQAALYRSLVAGKRMLVVLDNAASSDQVVPLLPGSASCTVLVTGRVRLASLIDRYGARHLPLDVLTRDEAQAMLAARVGYKRVHTESPVIGDLIEMCGRHPLALAITARHATTRPRVPLTEIAAELRDLGLDMFDNDDPTASLPAVLSWSLRHLTDDQRTVFALLGIAPGPDVDLHAAASLAHLPTARTRNALRALEDHCLIDRHAGGRYAMHDLIRAYATTVAHNHLPEPEREAALDRVVEFYLHTAFTAERLLTPHRPPIRLDPPAPGAHCHPLSDVPAALAWMDTHHTHLLAAQQTAADHHRHHAVWNIAWSLATFHRRRGHLQADLAVWQAAANAAEHLPAPATRILTHRMLGHAHAELEQHEQAMAHLHQALALAEHHHDLVQRAHTHHALTWAWEQRGDDQKALEHARHTLDIFRSLDSPVWEATALNMVGWYAARLGEYDTAREHCQAALALYRRHDDPDGEADSLDSLGWIDHHTGHHHRAISRYGEALSLYRTVGNTTEAADTLANLGHPHRVLGHHAQARAVWHQALELYREQDRGADAERVRRQLDNLTPPVAAERAQDRRSVG